MNTDQKKEPNKTAVDAQAQWLSGTGGGALSVVRLTGKDSWGILQKSFRSQNGDLPLAYRPGLARLGTLPDEKGTGDQLLLVCRFWRGKRVVELQSHHGVLADAHLTTVLEKLGFQILPTPDLAPTPPPEINLALEKERWLPFVPNRVALERFLGWIDRDWPREIGVINAFLDEGKLSEANLLIQESLRFATLGSNLFRPLRVAFLGVPNAGKSSLLNALVGFERALVSQTPGTTRDLVRATVAHKGWVIELIDSAGIRTSTNDLEGEGIQRSMAVGKEADLVLWLVDPTQPIGPPEGLNPQLFVRTKSDMNESLPDETPEGKEILARSKLATSSKTGKGLEPLLNQIVDKLVGPLPQTGVMVPFSPALVGCLTDLGKLIQTERIPEAKRILAALLETSQGNPPR